MIPTGEAERKSPWLRSRRFLSHRLSFGEPESSYKSVVEVAPGRVLAGMFDASAALMETNQVTRVALARKPPFSAYVVTAIADRHGRYWIGTQQDGLYLVDGPQSRHVSLPETVGAYVFALFEDSVGRLWLGTRQGLLLYDGATRTKCLLQS